MIRVDDCVENVVLGRKVQEERSLKRRMGSVVAAIVFDIRFTICA